jgi:hypothetical protein
MQREYTKEIHCNRKKKNNAVKASENKTQLQKEWKNREQINNNIWFKKIKKKYISKLRKKKLYRIQNRTSVVKKNQKE